MAEVAEPQLDPRRWVALLTCCCALLMTLLDVSVTNVALPSIGQSTGSTPAQLQWVVSGYTLAFGLVPVLAGRLGDDNGRPSAGSRPLLTNAGSATRRSSPGWA